MRACVCECVFSKYCWHAAQIVCILIILIEKRVRLFKSFYNFNRHPMQATQNQPKPPACTHTHTRTPTRTCVHTHFRSRGALIVSAIINNNLPKYFWQRFDGFISRSRLASARTRSPTQQPAWHMKHKATATRVSFKSHYV